MKKALPSGTADFEVLKTKPRNPDSSDSFILKFVRKNPDKNRIDPFFWVNISIANALCHAGRWFFVRQFFRETRSRPRLHRIPFRTTLILQKLPENPHRIITYSIPCQGQLQVFKDGSLKFG